MTKRQQDKEAQEARARRRKRAGIAEKISVYGCFVIALGYLNNRVGILEADKRTCEERERTLLMQRTSRNQRGGDILFSDLVAIAAKREENE